MGTKSDHHQLAFAECQTACTNGKNPNINGANLQCSAMNHRSGLSSFAQDCQLFSRDQVQHTDGYMEADDRYTFYWKFCIDTIKSCTGDYAFTFLSDRYMIKNEVAQTKFTSTLEECLAECLKDSDILCRSVSFNRTDGGCHISEQNQLSKPSAIRINNDPNYRIDYYENNCYNNSFTFSSNCDPDGIRVSVNSRIPYTGALYGLYDFFTCRIEPKEAKQFEFLFPYPNVAKNCSDSMRQSGDDVILEVVLSTDGVEPLYFITADDLTYQAKCPFPKEQSIEKNSIHQTADDNWRKNDGKKKSGATINAILESLYSAAAAPQTSLRRFGVETNATTTTISSSHVPSIQQNLITYNNTTETSFTKDTFTLLPLYTLITTKKEANINIPNTVQIRDSLFHNDNRFLTTPAIKVVESSSPTTQAPLTKIYSTSNDTTTATSINSKMDEKLQITQEPTEKAKTILVSREILSDKFNASSKNGKTEVTHRNESNGINNGSKIGMEPIFEDFYHTQTTSPSGDITTKTTTKRSVSATTRLDNQKEFSFSTHLTFTPHCILFNAGPADKNDGKTTNAVASASVAISTTTTTPIITTTLPVTSTTLAETTTKTTSKPIYVEKSTTQREKIIFEIFHNGQPTEAVVVGSRITLAFTPYLAIPPEHMAISGCQVEPIGSLYEWEKEPLAIIKDGCQADHVGLVCPPQKIDYGIRVTIEAFRYQTTTQVQYTCLIRVCPFATCPQVTCPLVEGCPGDDIVSRTFGINRAKRNDYTVFQQNEAFQIGNVFNNRANLWNNNQPMSSRNNAHHQQLLLMGGDTIVHRKLIVVNSDDELRYYMNRRTGEVPSINPRK